MTGKKNGALVKKVSRFKLARVYGKIKMRTKTFVRILSA
jgi:hypothetical protein